MRGITPAPDRSLTPKEYISKGLPQIDKPWKDLDYLKAMSVLMPIVQRDPTKLPRYDSPRSGTVFARFVSDDNLAKSVKATRASARSRGFRK